MVLNIPDINYNDIPGSVVYEVVMGSHSQNLATRSSDIDIKGVFIASEIDLYTGDEINIYKVTNNIVFYELTYFLKLLAKGDITAIEMLFVKEGFVNKSNSIFNDMIIKNRNMFISQKLFEKIESLLHSNFDKQIIDLKDIKINPDLKPIDFIVYLNQNMNVTEPLSDYLNRRTLNIERKEQKYAFKKIPNMNGMYFLYYDVFTTFGTGISIRENQLVESNNISDNEKPIGIVYFDAKKYSTYLSELKKEIDKNDKRNKERWKQDPIQNNVYYNSKALCHCMRILLTYLEYLDTYQLNVFREADRNYLLSIKMGKTPLQFILDEFENKSKIISKLFDDKREFIKADVSDLYVKHILTDVRKKFYAQELAVKRMKNKDMSHKVY